MARLTNEELKFAIETGPDAIDSMIRDGAVDDAQTLMHIIIEMAKAVLEDAKEIQTLRQQNADMAAWINAQCGGV